MIKTKRPSLETKHCARNISFLFTEYSLKTRTWRILTGLRRVSRKFLPHARTLGTGCDPFVSRIVPFHRRTECRSVLHARSLCLDFSINRARRAFCQPICAVHTLKSSPIEINIVRVTNWFRLLFDWPRVSFKRNSENYCDKRNKARSIQCVFFCLHFGKLLEIVRSMYNSSNLLIILVILKRVLCDEYLRHDGVCWNGRRERECLVASHLTTILILTIYQECKYSKEMGCDRADISLNHELSLQHTMRIFLLDCLRFDKLLEILRGAILSNCIASLIHMTKYQRDHMYLFTVPAFLVDS